MGLESIALVVGVLLAPFALMAALVRMRTLGWRRAPRLLLLGTALQAVLMTSYWAFWWFAFDWVDGEAMPNRLFDVSTYLAIASALVCLCLCWAIAHAYRQTSSVPVRSGLSIYGPR